MLTARAGGCAEPEAEPAQTRLREGADFQSADELQELLEDEPRRMVQRGVGERLAEAIEREVRWLKLAGKMPGGLPWDGQPAWRVRLWEHMIDEQARVVAVERAMATW